jgi:hypothetical protein
MCTRTGPGAYLCSFHGSKELTSVYTTEMRNETQKVQSLGHDAKSSFLHTHTHREREREREISIVLDALTTSRTAATYLHQIKTSGTNNISSS